MLIKIQLLQRKMNKKRILLDFIKLFLTPYAVADISCYDNLIKSLKNNSNDNLEIIPVELKSHGTRRKETPYKSIDKSARDVQRIINENMCNDFVDFINNNMKESIKKSLDKDIDHWLV